MSTSTAFRQTDREIERLDKLLESKLDEENLSVGTILYINARLLIEIAAMLNSLCEVENVSERLRSK